VYEVQCEVNLVYSDVCLRYNVREMLVQGCVSVVQSEGNIGYSDVCMRYRVREILCTVMCV